MRVISTSVIFPPRSVPLLYTGVVFVFLEFMIYDPSSPYFGDLHKKVVLNLFVTTLPEHKNCERLGLFF